jgi:type VI secretion system protein ImpE
MPEPVTAPSAGSLLREGKLGPALAAATAELRKQPSNLGARILVAELLLISGNLERADVILDAAADIDPGSAVAVAAFRQLLRADMARRQLRRDGRVPEFLGEPTPACRTLLAGYVALRDGDMAGAASAAALAEATRPRVPGDADDEPFDDFRDGDDLSAGIFEVLTTTGKYFWIPTERVEAIELHPPARAQDLAWRRASMTVRDGPDGDVYLPVTYDWNNESQDDALRLGRATDWRTLLEPSSNAPGLMQGLGQRTFLAGERSLEIMAATRLRFGAL